jgi:NADH:ubiquinone oxidoreductase subunit 5 (subunit L)/multisubunit Na+/H+ antiporter MnhA subunit
MNELLQFFIYIPVAGFVLSLFIPQKQEGILSKIAFGTTFLQMAFATVFIAQWLLSGHHALNTKEFVVFKAPGYEFFIDIYFDIVTAFYVLVGSLLAFLVTMYSRFYLHREQGYKRFFNTVLLFFFGFNFTIFAGNMETLFIGWEILGISSFLLIAFYRERYLPVKNAVKVFSIYRIGDVGILLAMWLSHHLWHENITFMKLNNFTLVNEHLQTHSAVGIFISLMLLIAAAAKSAQLPFSSWLPRAMEGPTPSSAIFYGSLSVHMGVFLMLRTFPFWEHQVSIKILIALLGFSTTLISTGIARVQSSVKSQIAYSSIAQIGLIFVEIAFGLKTLALFHFAGNAFLRTYQLLVSPSVVSYLIREQFYNFSPSVKSLESNFPKKLQYTLYILCLREWNLDSFMYRTLWNPLKSMGKSLNFLSLRLLSYIFIPLYLLGVAGLWFREFIPGQVLHFLPILFSFTGLSLVLKAFTERKSARTSWVMVIMNHFWIALAVSYNTIFDKGHVVMYLSGVVVSGIIGYNCLQKIKKLEGSNRLHRFHGHAYEHPKIALIFLLACLGLTGFPITPTFVGEDLIFSHINSNQFALAGFVALSFIVDSLAIIRIYARVFLGPHIKSYHEVAYRSS